MLPKPKPQLLDLAKSHPDLPAWLRAEMERARPGDEWETLVLAGLRLRYAPDVSLFSIRDLLEGRPPVMDPLRLWLFGLAPHELHAIDDIGRRHAEVLAVRLAKKCEDPDLDSRQFCRELRNLSRERDRLEGIRTVLGWRQSVHDQDPAVVEDKVRRREKAEAEAADYPVWWLALNGRGPPIATGAWGPLVVNQVVEPSLLSHPLILLENKLYDVDTAMLAWLESLHRHPHIDDAWLQAVAELDPLAWWGTWSSDHRSTR